MMDVERVLVSGGLGFVGINLVRDLAQQGWHVTAADVLQPDAAALAFLRPVMDRVEIRRLDVTDRTAYRLLAEEQGCDCLVHAAALTPDPEVERAHAVHLVDVNLCGSLNALALGMELPQIRRVLLASSSGVYGAPPRGVRRQSEQGRLELDSLYAVTKVSAEWVARRYRALSSTKFAAVRLGSVYGPMERPTGSRQHMSHIQRLRAALQTGAAVRVWGAEIGRDWVHAGDISGAVAALLRSDAWEHAVYNIGSGKIHLFRQVVELFQQHGLRAEWVDNPAQAEIAMRPEGARAALDMRLLKKDTGFSPQISLKAGLEEIIRAEF